MGKKIVLVVGENMELPTQMVKRLHTYIKCVCVASFAEVRKVLGTLEVSAVITDSEVSLCVGAETSVMALVSITGECRNKEVPLIVVSPYKAPGGFKGPWVRQQGEDTSLLRSVLHHTMGIAS